MRGVPHLDGVPAAGAGERAGPKGEGLGAGGAGGGRAGIDWEEVREG